MQCCERDCLPTCGVKRLLSFRRVAQRRRRNPLSHPESPRRPLDFPDATTTEGAPPLRSLQGGNLGLVSLHSMTWSRGACGPPLAQIAKGGRNSEAVPPAKSTRKGWGHPPCEFEFLG